MQGSQMCKNPGGKPGQGKTPGDKISQGQQQLNEQMKKMKEGLEKGKQGQGGMSKEFAQMAAKQAALRKHCETNKKKSNNEVKAIKNCKN